ncbi:MAG: heterotetrameric sarcosine oxidase beta subunit [Paracoccaceae bacterium]|jgi:heterotetrameric sarcosine oxidase beta subunit
METVLLMKVRIASNNAMFGEYMRESAAFGSSSMRYSGFKVLKEALTGHKGWKPVWREPEPKPEYDIIVVGGGGHGLATAYYLAKEFKEKSIAVIEKGWIGSGNVGRNTTIIRSNYMLPGNEPFYEFSLKLWENLEQDFNYNAMISQRSILNLIHNDPQRDSFVRRANSMLLAGADADMLSQEELREMLPFLDFDNARFPIKGGLRQKRGGTVRHDAVAWGFARGADMRGVDIIQNCEVTGFVIKDGVCSGVETSKGIIKAKKVGVAVAGSSGRVMAKAGMRLPIESHVLQAFVTEGLKPVLPGVITFGAGHFYVSQSDKGGLVFGGDIDGYNTYAQRGNLPVVEDVCEGGMAIMPMIGRARLLRGWGGIMDMSMDGSPFIDKTHIDGLYFNGGWCYGGFKATPASGWCFAHLLSKDTPHPTATEMRLDRFMRGHLIDEKGMGAQPNLH